PLRLILCNACEFNGPERKTFLSRQLIHPAFPTREWGFQSLSPKRGYDVHTSLQITQHLTLS
ncbi:hypothetical protein, partial [Nostoc sp.]|uniref:hypothetical protein n=1 Tax=Nostoc sp. TaxID=1180 RepID=UPI002FF6A705